MRLMLLGPMQLVDDAGECITVPGPRQRILLAALAVHANQPVSLDALAEVIWDGAPPPGSATTFRSHLARLRRRVGPRIAGRIVTRAAGYAIELNDDELDLLAFENHCRHAGAALHAGDHTQACASGTMALRLWRGEPLSDVPSQLLREMCVPRLERLRVQVAEDWIEAELRLGHHEPVLEQLRDLTARYPLHERFHAQLMLALTRSGHRAEALAAYQSARKVLVAELGIEPGPELRTAHARILADERTALAAPPTRSASPSTPASPVVHPPLPSPVAASRLSGRGRRSPMVVAGALLSALLLFATCADTPPSEPHQYARSASPTATFGIWTSADSFSGYSTVAGQHPNVANVYLFWGNSFPTLFVGQAHSAGATPFVEIEPWQGALQGQPGDCDYGPDFPSMTTIGANGSAISSYLNAFGSAIASFGHPVIVTFAREFNLYGQYPWAQGGCEDTSPAQWIKAWDTVRSDVDATADGLASFMWAPDADTGGTTIDPTPYWPGASLVDMVGVEGFLSTRWGSQLGTFSGLFGPVFDQIHALTRLPIFIAETNLAPLDGSGYQSISGFISALCSHGGDGVLQFQETQTLSSTQWGELDKDLASDCGVRSSGDSRRSGG